MKSNYVLWVTALLLCVSGCASKEKRGSGDGSSAQEGEARTLLDKRLTPVYFIYDQSDLKVDAKGTLAQHLAYLKENPNVKIQIEGHCDERGTVEYNLALGEKRALSVKDYLVAGGVPTSRFTFISYGEERPAEAGSTEDMWTKNRRAEFVLYK